MLAKHEQVDPTPPDTRALINVDDLVKQIDINQYPAQGDLTSTLPPDLMAKILAL
jgi:hypothetical protein